MTVMSSSKDEQALSFTLIAEFDVAPERVWEVWADPRQLERWWGPPTWPATFDSFDFTPGGRVSYYMTGPDGEKARGWWRVTAVEAPHRLSLEDGFADDAGHPVAELGITHMTATLADLGGRTRMTIVSSFESLEQMRTIIQMGMEEGLREAAGQIDALLLQDAR